MAYDSVTEAYYYYTSCGRRSYCYFHNISIDSGLSDYKTTYSYNKAGLITSLYNSYPDGSVISSYSYTYRPDGNIASETEYQSNFVDKNLTTYYNYDMLGRLISEQSAKSSKVYSYDDAGNRTRVIIDSSSTINYSYVNGRLVSKTENTGSAMNTVTYTYDSNGNLISETEGIKTTSYTYDVWGNVITAGDTTYGYDYAGLRISKNSDRFYNINGVVAIEKVGETVYSSLLGAERVRRNNTLYLYDGHGNVVDLLGSSGIEKVYDYDAYGNHHSIATGDTNPFRYCGEYYDEETGLIYLRARYYSPENGRFISQDPAKDGINWYTYCADNPLAYVDRNGMWLETVWDIISLGTSIVDVYMNPTDPLAWAGLVGDAVDVLVPCFGGFGETIKGAGTVADIAKATNKADDAVDAAADTAKKLDKLREAAKKVAKGADEKVDAKGFSEWLSKGDRKYQVYRGIDKSGNKVYVGITKQSLPERLYQHKYRDLKLPESKKKGLHRLEDIYKNVTKAG